MRIARSLAGFVLVATSLSADLAFAADPDGTYRVASAAESGAAVLDLLIPFLARLNFGEGAPRTLRPSGLPLATFRRADGDSVLAVVDKKCVLLGFVATRHPTAAPAQGPSDRSGVFGAELKRFLAGLPTPRPQLLGESAAYRTNFGPPPICPHAF